MDQNLLLCLLLESEKVLLIGGEFLSAANAQGNDSYNQGYKASLALSLIHI